MSKRYNETSNYPSEVDPLIFMSDSNLRNLSEVKEHEQLLHYELYTQAGEYIENANVDSFCASLFNLLNNRIYSLEYHLKATHTKWYEEHGVETPFEYVEMPEDTDAKPIWNNLYDLSIISNVPLSGSYSLSAIGGFRP